MVISLNVIEEKTKNRKSEKKINTSEQLPDRKKNISEIQSDEKAPQKNALSEANVSINSKEKTESDSEPGKNTIFQNKNNSQEYLEKISKEIQKKKKYPEIAKKRNMSGSVTLHLTTDNHLNLTECFLVKSSGYKILDNDAMELVRNIFPLEGVDDTEHPEINEEITIDYRLNIN